MVAASPLIHPEAPRAFRLFHQGRLLGYLGEEPGRFESVRGASEPGPPGCRFRSTRAETESAIVELLHATTDFEALLDVLRRAGLHLEPAGPSGLFTPSPVIFRTVVPSTVEARS